jgi:hypothetical protein
MAYQQGKGIGPRLSCPQSLLYFPLPLLQIFVNVWGKGGQSIVWKCLLIIKKKHVVYIGNNNKKKITNYFYILDLKVYKIKYIVYIFLHGRTQ